MYILALDQGTTSSRVVLYKNDLTIITRAQQELTQIYPQKISSTDLTHSSWIEHDPVIIFNDIIKLINTCLDQASDLLNITKTDLIKKIISIGITNQRETTVIWDKTTGQPIHNAIVWQDRRTTDYCNNLKNNNYSAVIQQKTGLLIDPYFSASKINWILDKYNLHHNKNILFGTIDTYLIWRLTDGQAHVTDATNASRTQLYNIKTLAWDPDLLNIFNIPKDILPTVKNSIDNFGITNSKFFGGEIPINAVAGDQQAAAIGQLCITAKSCKITYGTGCFVLQNTGDKFIISNHKLISTIAYMINNKPIYALEGSIFVAGATVQWLRDAVKLINKAEDSEDIAKNLADTNGVYLIPAFTGLGAPYWDPEARGAILGLTRETGFQHIVRAALESVCYQTRDLLSAFEQDYGLPESIKVDGGMTANNWLMQFLADIIQLNIEKPLDTEATVKGVAILSAIGSGVYPSLTDFATTYKAKYTGDLKCQYYPMLPTEISDKLYQGWVAAVQKLLQKQK